MSELHPWLMLTLTAASMTCTALNQSLRDFSRVRLDELLGGSTAANQRLTNLEARLDDYILTTAALRQVVNVLLILVVGTLVEQWLPASSKLSHLVTTFAVGGGLLLVFSVLVPFALAGAVGERLLATCLPLLGWVRKVCFPLLWLMRPLDKTLRRMAGPIMRPTSEVIEEEILKVVTEGHREGILPAQESAMLRGAIQFAEARVTRVMTPRTDMVGVPAEASVIEAARLMAERGHRRLPVFVDDLDNIVGILDYRDMLTALSARAVVDGTPVLPPAASPPAAVPSALPRHTARGLCKPALMIPESRRLDDLLREFRARREAIAIVLDEYGGVSGLVTERDMLAMIVGETGSATKLGAANRPVRVVAEGQLEIDGRLHVGTLNEHLTHPIPENDAYETVAGFVTAVLGTIPRPGERFRFGHAVFTVLEADERTVRRLRLETTPAALEHATATGLVDHGQSPEGQRIMQAADDSPRRSPRSGTLNTVRAGSDGRSADKPGPPEREETSGY